MIIDEFSTTPEAKWAEIQVRKSEFVVEAANNAKLMFDVVDKLKP